MITFTEDLLGVAIQDRIRKWLTDPAALDYFTALDHIRAKLELEAAGIVLGHQKTGRTDLPLEAIAKYRELNVIDETKKLMLEHIQRSQNRDNFLKIIPIVE